MKLMDIDSDSLGIPDTEYDARVTMPSSEFTRIVRDLSQLGESVRIEVSKEGVRFASEGEAANGSVLLRQVHGATISGGKLTAGTEEAKEDADGDGEDADAEGSTSKKKIKKEKKDNEDVEMNDEDGEKEADAEKKDDGVEENEDDDTEFRPEDGEKEADAEKEDEDEENEDDDGSSKKRKKKVMCFLLKLAFGC